MRSRISVRCHSGMIQIHATRQKSGRQNTSYRQERAMRACTGTELALAGIAAAAAARIYHIWSQARLKTLSQVRENWRSSFFFAIRLMGAKDIAGYSAPHASARAPMHRAHTHTHARTVAHANCGNLTSRSRLLSLRRTRLALSEVAPVVTQLTHSPHLLAVRGQIELPLVLNVGVRCEPIFNFFPPTITTINLEQLTSESLSVPALCERLVNG